MILETLPKKIKVPALVSAFIFTVTHFGFHAINVYSTYLEFISCLIVIGMIVPYSIYYSNVIREYLHPNKDAQRLRS